MGQTEISGRCYDKNGEYNVVDFACANSRRVGILHTLSDMRRKLSAGFGLRVDRVPVAYHRPRPRLSYIPFIKSQQQSTSSTIITLVTRLAAYRSATSLNSKLFRV
jgi:hypothetical protein